MKTPIEMLNAIIKMQEANYGNGMRTHLELSVLVKEAKEVVKNRSIPDVGNSVCTHPDKKRILCNEILYCEECMTVLKTDC